MIDPEFHLMVNSKAGRTWLTADFLKSMRCPLPLCTCGSECGYLSDNEGKHSVCQKCGKKIKVKH